MKEIKTELQLREKYLFQLKEEKEGQLKDEPEGHLRVCQSGNKVQYYKRTDPKDYNGTYISEKEMNIAYKLAQKDYDRQIIRAAETELKAIQKYLSVYPKKSAEELYESLHPARQKLIVPVRETDEAFAANWKKISYRGKDFYNNAAEYYTIKGERVRSKSELIIADTLERENIPYRYEYPIYMKGIGRIYPDFTVLNVKKRKELVWEHFEMMDIPEYAENFVQKINSYVKNGYYQGENLICTFETKDNPLNLKTIKSIIKHYFV